MTGQRWHCNLYRYLILTLTLMMILQGDVPRVNGQLAVSRAFGDKSLKSHLRSDPDVQNTNIDVDNDFLILASDGLWKVK